MTVGPAVRPTTGEVNEETNPTRKAVLAAMVRMLGGTPSVVRPGLLSKAALAREAQVDRNQISQGSCRDLGDRFATITQQNTAPATAREAEQLIRIEHLTAQLQQLTKGRAELRADKDRWQESTHTLLRGIQVLRLEHSAMQADIRILRKQLAAARAGEAHGLYSLPPGQNLRQSQTAQDLDPFLLACP
jgi:hypothetical protein